MDGNIPPGGTLSFSVLTRQESMSLGIILQGSLDRMTHVATCVLAEYRNRYLRYSDLMTETAEIVAAVTRDRPVL